MKGTKSNGLVFSPVQCLISSLREGDSFSRGRGLIFSRTVCLESAFQGLYVWKGHSLLERF